MRDVPPVRDQGTKTHHITSHASVYIRIDHFTCTIMNRHVSALGVFGVETKGQRLYFFVLFFFSKGRTVNAMITNTAVFCFVFVVSKREKESVDANL